MATYGEIVGLKVEGGFGGAAVGAVVGGFVHISRRVASVMSTHSNSVSHQSFIRKKISPFSPWPA